MDKKKAKTSNAHLITQFYPPVVAVLGHVDHGKTSLLDAIRKSDIAKREHGGITQKIGASTIEVTHEKKLRRITFIDTPGHEAFSKMRGRGAQAADIGLLIISAIDGVMPQTKESLALLKGTKIPYIVVLTKIDVDTANPQRIKQQLLKEEVLLEGLGGDVPVIEVSAKQGTNIHELLELILLVFDMQLSSNSHLSASDPLKGIIIESRLDPRSGPRATLVVKKGTIQVRDTVVSENMVGKVKTLIQDTGLHVTSATIGEAVEIMGFDKVPPVGSTVTQKELTEKKEIAQEFAPVKLLEMQAIPEQHVLSIILCADNLGSLEAILNSLPPEIHIMAQKVGEISEADVLLAKSVQAIIIGFNTKIRNEVTRLASEEKVLMKNYTIIYELLDELNDVLEGKQLALVEKILGRAKVLAVFPFDKTFVLGVKVLIGRIAKGDRVKILRNDDEVGQSHVTSLRHGKDQISKMEKGSEAGVILSPFLDFTIGDVLVSTA